MVERPGLLAPVGERRHDMVLEVLAHALQFGAHIYAMRAQLVRFADAGEHEELRRVDHAAREQHLPLRPRDAFDSPFDELHAYSATLL